MDATAGNSKNITAAAIAASRGMPPLQLVACPPRRRWGKESNWGPDWTECYRAERDSMVFVCNGMRTTDVDIPVSASCGKVLSEADWAKLQAEAAARAMNSATLPMVRM
jgi:hypothetical protein